jgi:predicted DNA-binding protein
MTLMITLPPALEEQLRQEANRFGLSVGEYSAQALEQHLTEVRKRHATVDILESWLNDDAVEQQATGEELVRSLDDDRLSARSLFPAELKGITW